MSTFKVKGDALERGRYSGLKVLEQVMKRLIEKLIREIVKIKPT